MSSPADRKEYLQNWYRQNKASHNEKNQDWYALNKKRKNQQSLEWHKNNPRRSKAIHLRKYNLTVDQYEAMLASQGGVCAICSRPEANKRMKYLSVDHCHKTGKVRGLLCRNCNAAMGLLKESLDAIDQMRQYLTKHKEK